MRHDRAVLTVALALTLAGPASAAPTVGSVGLGIEVLGVAGFGVWDTGTYDVTGSTFTVPAGLVGLGSSIVIPVTATSALDTLSITRLSNLAGTFSLGGVTAQAPGEVCPGGGPASGAACNAGGGIGGVMGLTGTIFLNVVPGIVVIPVNLNTAQIGQGGSTNAPMTIDAAAWSTGPGRVNLGFTTHTRSSATGTGIALQLVAPSYVSTLGLLLPTFATWTFGTLALPLPEPAAWLLLGLGVVGLCAARRG